MRKPREPSRPTKPIKPQELLPAQLRRHDISYGVSIKHLIDIVGNDIDLEKVCIGSSDDDYLELSWYAPQTKNLKYDKQMDQYNIKMLEYENKMKIFDEKMKNFRSQQKIYLEWHYTNELKKLQK